MFVAGAGWLVFIVGFHRDIEAGLAFVVSFMKGNRYFIFFCVNSNTKPTFSAEHFIYNFMFI